MAEEKGIHFRQISGRWRCIAIVFILISLVLAAVVAYLAVLVNSKQQQQQQQQQPPPPPSNVEFCGTSPSDNIDVSESPNPGIFDDLTSGELSALQTYIYSQNAINLVSPSEIQLGKSYVFTMDLHLPSKDSVLRYLDGNMSKPNREALVVIFREDKSPPVVEEYIVGPLPNPSYMRLRHDLNRANPIRYNYRPLGDVEAVYLYEMYVQLGLRLKDILKESYDAGVKQPDCGNKCLSYYPVAVGSGVLGVHERKLWLIASRVLEYYTLHLLDLAFLFTQNSTNPTHYFVETVVYNGQKFDSVDEFVTKYNAGQVTKQRVPFPNVTSDLFSTMNLRGNPVPQKPKRAPKLFEPDGKRYNITHRYVEYMQWKFNFRMSVFSGPQIYNVRFNDERIAYEISLQEIAVYYSGHNSPHKFSDFTDSSELLGTTSRGLIPGTDCPDTSTFINGFYLKEYAEGPEWSLSMACIFEENSGFPLRRHAGYESYQGQFYSGMMDSSLVVRSILTIGNYDYIVDYIFHQNGALQIRAAATGFIFASFYTPEEGDYGFKLHDYITGNIHHHMFNFKLDIDVHGTSNRYETLDISPTEVNNDYSVSNATYWQIKFERKLKESELEAAYKYDFEHPKYHLIHNNEVKTRHGEISGYRVHLEGMSLQPLPQNVGNEATISWSRYQLAVTRSNDTERSSTSIYGMFDSLEPVVNFTSFLADDQSIVDKDFVMWASVGVHHIPHTEDLPVTPTTGGHLGIYLLPYNYFQECPSVASRDALRLEPKDGIAWTSGFKVDRYGNTKDVNCVPKSVNIDD